jgi:hypothetical protein
MAGGQWKIDLPDQIDAQKLQQNLDKHLKMVADQAEQWPQDATEAQRFISHHVLMAFYDTQGAAGATGRTGAGLGTPGTSGTSRDISGQSGSGTSGSSSSGTTGTSTTPRSGAAGATSGAGTSGTARDDE